MNELERLQNLLDDLQVQLEGVEDEIRYFDVSEYASESDYDDWLNDCYGDVEVCGMTYCASNALSSIDPIAYHCGFSDYCDGLDPADFPDYVELTEKAEDLQTEIDGCELDIEDLEQLEGEENA